MNFLSYKSTLCLPIYLWISKGEEFIVLLNMLEPETQVAFNLKCAWIRKTVYNQKEKGDNKRILGELGEKEDTRKRNMIF